MKRFEVFFSDLTPEAQARLIETLETIPENENWEDNPIAVIERDDRSIHENAHVSVRITEWREFSKHMEEYIQGHTLDKYGLPSHGDLLEISCQLPVICIWNVLKYSLRVWNCCGKEHDVEKMAHYAQRYWTLNHERSGPCPDASRK